ncbi:MAG TPA: response regulator transcription factor [Gaiellaceae bacterium]
MGAEPYRILVAEDDEAFLDVVEALLTAEGFAVVGRAAHGREAVELAAELDIDAVVIDIEMPVVDGVEATRRLREQSAELPIVAISGHDYEERVLEIRAAGADDYVRKARLEEELADALFALVSLQRGRLAGLRNEQGKRRGR